MQTISSLQLEDYQIFDLPTQLIAHWQMPILALVFFLTSTGFSMIGIGGGIFYVPILLFAGFTFKQAPAISLILIATASTSALFTFWRNHKIDWKLALVVEPCTDVMAFIGGYYSALIPESILMYFLAGILVIAGILMLKNDLPQIRETPSKRWCWHRNFHDVEYTINVPYILIATAIIGIFSGMLGITGGVIKLPILVLLCQVPIEIAIATSTAMVAITALAGLAGHAISGPINWHIGGILALSTVTGGFLGSKISISMNKARLRRIFAIVVLLMAVCIIGKWSG